MARLYLGLRGSRRLQRTSFVLPLSRIELQAPGKYYDDSDDVGRKQNESLRGQKTWIPGDRKYPRGFGPCESCAEAVEGNLVFFRNNRSFDSFPADNMEAIDHAWMSGRAPCCLCLWNCTCCAGHPHVSCLPSPCIATRQSTADISPVSLFQAFSWHHHISSQPLASA
jgi:hypothetical protein